MINTAFVQLNQGWNAEPNAPEPHVSVDGSSVSISFYLNASLFSRFTEGDRATLRFENCERYRIGPTNDEGWYMGKCRFSQQAPGWGEFYAVAGEPDLLLQPTDWIKLSPRGGSESAKHYLFYFRDQTFECVADRWEVRLP